MAYECKEFIDGVHAAEASGISAEKSIEMIHTRDILAFTGYVRGGCSPIGMKKQFPTVIDASASGFEQISVSGGRIGLSLLMSPEDLIRITKAQCTDVILEANLPQ